MADTSPLWPSRVDHIRLDSDRPEELVSFYGRALRLAAERIADDLWLLAGAERRLLIGRGAPKTLGFGAFDLESPERLAAMRTRLEERQIPILPSPSPLFGEDAFAVRDPDEGTVVFGIADRGPAGIDALPGRLQHFVVATTRLRPMADFYADALGLVVSDWVREEDGTPTACFLRSDPEHHSFAVFRAPAAGFDHFACEVRSWNDIRDWADHMAQLRIPLWWGPGRHGPGDNLFFMVEDPDGNKVELSAELEHMPRDMAPREWPHDERTLNLWGQAWMRS